MLYSILLYCSLLKTTLLYMFIYIFIYLFMHPPAHHMITSHTTGSVAYAIDRVLSGKNRNAFCVVRPPGHHAGTFAHLNPPLSSYFPFLHSYCLSPFLTSPFFPPTLPTTPHSFFISLHPYPHHIQFTH